MEKKAWQVIAQNVSSKGVCTRTPAKVKNNWRKMKNIVAQVKRSKKKTGGGKAMKDPAYEGAMMAVIPGGEMNPSFCGVPDGESK